MPVREKLRIRQHHADTTGSATLQLNMLTVLRYLNNEHVCSQQKIPFFSKEAGKIFFAEKFFTLTFAQQSTAEFIFHIAICLPISGICLRWQKSLLGTWQQWLLYLNMFAKAERMRTPATRNTVQNRMVITMNTQFHLNRTNFGVLKSTLSQPPERCNQCVINN